MKKEKWEISLLPVGKKCYCGVEVLRKKLLKNDWKLFSCYECTY